MSSLKSIFASVLLISSLLLVVVDSNVVAADGQPIAIRHWPGGGITIETMWDLSVGVGIDEKAESKLPKKLDFKFADVKDETVATIARLPNAEKLTIGSHKIDPESGEISVQLPFGKQSDLVSVAKEKDRSFFTMTVGGTTAIVFTSSPNSKSLKSGTLSSAVDVSRIEVNGDQCLKIAEALKPALMIVPRSVSTVGDSDVKSIKHNTVAFAAAKTKNSKTRFVSLGEKPYEMNDELKTLFKKKEVSCRASQKFFAGLSVEQMNFKPDNGTHTPRWNPEHMMGRELLFFSQIYNAVDPTIPVMDLNPKQMPKDYKFAHPKWTGAEEARQIQRVEAFTRRFAYLLDGVDLDKRAPGSRFWTPRKLLAQMERHYNEHTANVKKKMELPGWPEK